ncbi:hypothetical protein [Roseofilum casamattae]|uniref:Uncharacterized protein n=1 Tax=Roseofilum casamattae BLCC-M143 TaxID=3022442 RepID=A0ABT7C2H4_9CYAN|nr:hypothetical protein [Roseofilum casamattae]MDJ1184939.1 hypothetical protein [Roseofilum casamattae BLCC-M143]
MRLKRWESPRRKGRNDKGKGGSARQRQLKKQTQMLRKRLKGENGKGKGAYLSSLFAVYEKLRSEGRNRVWCNRCDF